MHFFGSFLVSKDLGLTRLILAVKRIHWCVAVFLILWLEANIVYGKSFELRVISNSVISQYGDVLHVRLRFFLFSIERKRSNIFRLAGVNIA